MVAMRNVQKGAIISVIVPIYDVEQYLVKCIVSILDQTYNNLDIILVNDGSPDSCPKICDKYAQRDSRIRVIHKKNGGLSDARNVGLDDALGEYVVFIDSDDWIERHYIEKLYEAMLNSGADIAVANYRHTYEDGHIENPRRVISKHHSLSRNEALQRLLIERHVYEVVVWNKLYRINLFLDNDIKYPKGKINEDNYTTHKLYAASKRIAYIPDIVYNYRQRSGSIMQSLELEKYLVNIVQYSIEQYDHLDGMVPQSFRDAVRDTSHYTIVRQVKKRLASDKSDLLTQELGLLRSKIWRIIVSPHISLELKAKVIYTVMRERT